MKPTQIAALVSVLVVATAAASNVSVQQPARANAPQAVPRKGTAEIAGTVLSDETPPRPIRRATVIVSTDAALSGGMAAVTDDDGRFSVIGVPAGRYRLVVYKPAYLTGIYGATRQLRPGAARSGTIVAIEDGQRVSDLVIRMSRGSVLSGVVRDADGKPARSMRVEAYFFARVASGARELVAAQGGEPGGTLTDGRGSYRLYGLPPGDYVVTATPTSVGSSLEPTTAADVTRAEVLLRTPAQAASASISTPPIARRPTIGFAPIYFPGTSVAANASIVTLAPGEERSGLDFAVRPVPNVQLKGTVRTPDGQPAAGYSVRLVLEDASRIAARQGGSAITEAAGAFTIVGMAPGDYMIDVNDPRTGRAGQSATLSALLPITLGNDDARLDVTLAAGRTITGRLAFEATSLPLPQNLSSLYVALAPQIGPTNIGRTPRAVIATDGQFTISGVAPLKYTLAASIFPPPSRVQSPWYVKSATLNGQDILDRGIDVRPNVDLADLVVTFTDRPTEITGRMTNAQGQPAPEYFIIVFPSDQTQWTWQNRRIQQTRPTNDGAFAVRGVPPGDYLIGAVTDADYGEWFEPAFLRALAGGAIKVTLAEGEKKTQNISVK